ncbi:hypothetical protein DY000_02054497 [Brassica cretica]|uniref:Uncharacterized protein n=1 Tax=Brassica cretica TaxID=69181 RepID=A0ABQ7ADV0_BRACR|nr:hypothetical protein DY000_02054497 [Brassica cretica]
MRDASDREVSSSLSSQSLSPLNFVAISEALRISPSVVAVIISSFRLDMLWEAGINNVIVSGNFKSTANR